VDAELPQIGKARVARAGTDVSVIAYSAMVRNALEAADELARSAYPSKLLICARSYRSIWPPLRRRYRRHIE